MSDYTAFFLNASSEVRALECIEISHPAFSKVYCYVKNETNGITAGGKFYEFQPMTIKRNNVTNDLDQSISATLADVDDELIDAVELSYETEHRSVRAQLVYKVFRSDDLTTPMIELQTLEIPKISKSSDGRVTFDAKARGLNDVGTGRVYTFEEFPLLRGI